MNNSVKYEYEWIYLSPHLDDVALSCGGQIYMATQRKERVLIVTITAGDPVAPPSSYAESLHTRWDVVNATAARRQEDLAACAILGAEALHWDVPDCIYRVDATGNSLYLSDDDIFGPVAQVEKPLVGELAAKMRTLPKSRRVVAPLTVGNHVDHVLTRLAAESAYAQQPLLYYEDYPYAQQTGKLPRLLETGHWAGDVVVLSAEALQAKYEAVSAFRSQLSTFFRDRPDLEAQISSYAAHVMQPRAFAGTAPASVPTDQGTNQNTKQSRERFGERRWRKLPVVQ